MDRWYTAGESFHYDEENDDDDDDDGDGDGDGDDDDDDECCFRIFVLDNAQEGFIQWEEITCIRMTLVIVLSTCSMEMTITVT